MGYKVNKIRVGTQQVRPTGGKPSSNTLLYAPCKTDLKNMITQNVPAGSSNVSMSGGHLYVNTGYCHWTLPQSLDLNQPWTTNCFFKISGRSTYNYRILVGNGWSGSGSVIEVEYTNNQNNSLYGMPLGTIIVGGDNNTWVSRWMANGTIIPLNSRTFVCYVFDGEEAILYVNGKTGLRIPTNMINFAGTSRTCSQFGCGTTNNYDKYYGYMGDIILETKARTAEEVLNYYNSTKSNYGIS